MCVLGGGECCFEAENGGGLVVLFLGYFPFIWDTVSSGASRSVEGKVLVLKETWMNVGEVCRLGWSGDQGMVPEKV